MYREMLNLFANDNVSSLYVAAYMHNLAQKAGAGITVWHGKQEDFPDAVDDLARTLELAEGMGYALPKRSIFVYGLDSTGSEGLRRIAGVDPGVSVQTVDAHVPVESLLRLKMALSFCCPEDIETACAQKQKKGILGNEQRCFAQIGRH